MSDQEELRDDVPPKEGDETWQMADSPEEGQDNEASPHQGEEGQQESEA